MVLTPVVDLGWQQGTSGDDGYRAPIDWGLGQYERIAEEILPAALRVVDLASPQPGQRFLDLGCGTGNAALLVAAAGATTTGVDPSRRLLEVARARAAEAGRPIDFLEGEAAAIPVPDSSMDAIVSVFGLIFAADADAVATEAGRVLADDGRLLFSAWVPVGAIAAQARLRADAVASVRGLPSGAPPFAWHDEAALAALLARQGFTVTVQEDEIAFTAASADEYVRDQLAHHPMWLEARAVLVPAGRWDAVMHEMGHLFADANEDSVAFRVTSRYVIVTASR